MKSTALVVLLACAIVAVHAAFTEVAITPGTSILGLVNGTGSASDGILYSYTVQSAQINTPYNFYFSINLQTYLSGNTFDILTYYKDTSNAWTVSSSSNYQNIAVSAVQTSGLITMTADARWLYNTRATTSSAFTIGFLFRKNTVTSSASANGVYTALLTASASPLAVDANGQIPTDSEGPALTGTCMGAGTRCQVAALLSPHDHYYLRAQVATTNGAFYSATMRSAQILEFDDTEYFGQNTAVSVRTCVTNQTCDVISAFYYVDIVTPTNVGSSSSFSVTFRLVSAAATSAASIVTTAVAAAAAWFMTRA